MILGDPLWSGFCLAAALRATIVGGSWKVRAVSAFLLVVIFGTLVQADIGPRLWGRVFGHALFWGLVFAMVSAVRRAIQAVKSRSRSSPRP